MREEYFRVHHGRSGGTQVKGYVPVQRVGPTGRKDDPRLGVRLDTSTGRGRTGSYLWMKEDGLVFRTRNFTSPSLPCVLLL